MAYSNPSLCLDCVHYLGWPEGFVNGTAPKCVAFTEGIPWIYWSGGIPHIDPDTEGGIAFETRDGAGFGIDAFLEFWYEEAGASDPSYSGKEYQPKTD